MSAMAFAIVDWELYTSTRAELVEALAAMYRSLTLAQNYQLRNEN